MLGQQVASRSVPSRSDILSANGFLKDTPEFIESDLDEAILARNESAHTFKELGPPDLVHLSKSSRSGIKDVIIKSINWANLRSDHITSSQE